MPAEVTVTKRGKKPTGPEQPQTTAMLKARNNRKRAENDMKLLANRLAHLRAAEERAQKKIAETKQRTQEIVDLKQRNLDHQQNQSELNAERQVGVSTSQTKVNGIRRRCREQTHASRIAVVKARQQAAEQQRAKSKELNKATDELRSKNAERNRERNEQIRRQKEEARKRKESERAERELKRREEYQRQVKEEAERQQEAESIIHAMAQEEAKMLDRLKATQHLQRQAYEELQASLQL